MTQAQQAHQYPSRGRVARRLVPLVAAPLIVLAAAGPADAVSPPPPPTARNRTANAFWSLDGAVKTQVSLSPRAASTTQSVFVHIVQPFCDTATDQKVIRILSGDVPIRRKAFLMDRRLNSARLSVAVAVRGTEQRIAGCTVSFGGATTTALGNVTVRIHVRWQGTGPINEVRPGVQRRDAVANGTITGPGLPQGRLGVTTVASLETMAP